MAETGALLDRRGRPVTPAIAWHDARGAEQAEQLSRELGFEHFASHTGLEAGPLATIFKYRWLLENRPEATRGVRWLNVAEYIVKRLGGEETAELIVRNSCGGRKVPTAKERQ